MFTLKSLPKDSTRKPTSTTAGRFLGWLFKTQWPSLTVAGIFGTLWIAGIAAIPGAIGQGIDAISLNNMSGVWQWTAIIVVLALLIAVFGTIRHRFAVYNFLAAAYSVVQLTTQHTLATRGSLQRRITTGEVVSVGSADPSSIGRLMDVIGRLTGSIITFVAVAIILITISPTLGIVILIAIPVQALVIGPLLKPLQQREHEYRTKQGALTSRANDIVAGLRVLRGIGGESLFNARYRQGSEEVRRFGFNVATTSALMNGLQTLLPGLLLAGITWFGARLTAQGHISIGDLVAVFGYTSFLLIPMSVFLEAARKFTTAYASARRVVELLNVHADVSDISQPQTFPTHYAKINDPDSGLELRSGFYTAIAMDNPADAVALADRLARFVNSEVTVDGVPLSAYSLDSVRSHIVLSDNDAHFFAGTLREQLNGANDHSDETLMDSIWTSVATDAFDSVGGLDGKVDEGARNLSGGQRQRLRMARCIAANPHTLILIEPTSAVDAHTEALIAKRLVEHRQGLTTIIATTSPLLLEHADTIAYLYEGKIHATGRHAELIANEPRYRALVSRHTDTENDET